MKQLGQVEVNDRVVNHMGEFTVTKVQSTTFTMTSICVVSIEGENDYGDLCWEIGYSSDEIEVNLG